VTFSVHTEKVLYIPGMQFILLLSQFLGDMRKFQPQLLICGYEDEIK
jgi:hypothetical protein